MDKKSKKKFKRWRLLKSLNLIRFNATIFKSTFSEKSLSANVIKRKCLKLCERKKKGKKERKRKKRKKERDKRERGATFLAEV